MCRLICRQLCWPTMAGSIGVFCLAWIVQAAGPDSHGRNYDEEKVRPYTLPDPLRTNDGQLVTDAQMWDAMRRGEILGDFRNLMYGHTPELPLNVRAEVTAIERNAVGGLATRRLVRLRFFDDHAAPSIDLMLYVPNAVPKPVPVFLGLSFCGNASLEGDLSIPLPQKWMRNIRNSEAVVNHRATESLRGMHASRWPLELVLRRGYAMATFYYGDVEPDHIEGWREGIRGYALQRDGRTERGAHEWGALGAWAWGLSRAADYLENDGDIDGLKIAVFGFSRLGKAALWAGAQDPRFALVISQGSERHLVRSLVADQAMRYR